MAANEPIPPIDSTTQVATTNLSAGPVAPPPPDALYPSGAPDPAGTHPDALSEMERENKPDPNLAPGVEGEEVVWEARYAMKNFLGRLTWRALASFAWIALAIYTWGEGHPTYEVPAAIFGVILLLAWLQILYRIILARYGHYYRLTTRRLFVSTGLIRRRRDQMELLRVKDVFTDQTLVERWLALGSVIVVADDKAFPTFYLTGVHDPKGVMDLVWHHARTERDRRSVKIDRV